jgi:hypothetical protein
MLHLQNLQQHLQNLQQQAARRLPLHVRRHVHVFGWDVLLSLLLLLLRQQHLPPGSLMLLGHA